MRKLLVACLLLLPGAAWANTFDTFGLDPRGIALGGAQTADAPDYTAAFYNPSRLALIHHLQAGVSFTYERPSLTVSPLDPSQPVTSLSPPDFSSWALGFVFPFGGKVQDKVAIGLTISMPWKNLLRVQAADPGTPSWYLYQSSPDRIQIFVGLGIRPVDWLSIGVGAQVLADFGGDVNFNIDLFNKSFERRDLQNDLTTREAPVLGLTVIPLHNLQLGFTWRGTMQLDYELPNNITLGDLGTLFLDVKGVAFYTPHELVFGVRYDPIPALTLTADLEYALWSKAPNPAATVKVRLNGDLEKGLGLDKAVALDSSDVSPGFEDILIPRLGIAYQLNDRFTVRGGYFFRPTMVPLQNGLTNLLDGSAHVLSVGLAVTFPDPLEILSNPIGVELTGQRAFLVDREADKPQFSPVPSYTYGGNTTLITAGLRFTF